MLGEEFERQIFGNQKYMRNFQKSRKIMDN
jgi:hypothetical protein